MVQILTQFECSIKLARNKHSVALSLGNQTFNNVKHLAPAGEAYQKKEESNDRGGGNLTRIGGKHREGQRVEVGERGSTV